MTPKHTISTLFGACMGLCITVLPLSAATFGKFTYKDNGDSITITDYPSSLIGAVNIPASIDGKPVTSIGDEAFYYCDLSSVTIPSSVTSIGFGAFDYCSNLTAINVDLANPQYSSLSGILFNKEQTILLQYPRGIQGSYDIPSSVTSIGDSAFYYCASLTSVTILSGVTSIGGSAFSYCSGLTSVIIPSSVTSIGDRAFRYCS